MKEFWTHRVRILGKRLPHLCKAFLGLLSWGNPPKPWGLRAPWEPAKSEGETVTWGWEFDWPQTDILGGSGLRKSCNPGLLRCLLTKMRAGADYHSEWQEAPHVLCKFHGGYHRPEPLFVGGGCAWSVRLGEGCILTCPRKEDPIVLSLHRWAQRRKEEGRPEEKRVRSSA